MKKRIQHSCFTVNIAKLLTTAFLWNTSAGYFSQIDKVNCYWASADLLFLIKNTIGGGFSLKGLQIFS